MKSKTRWKQIGINEMIQRLLKICTVLVVLSLVSCGAIFTTTSEPVDSPPTNRLGSYYFLPKTRIKIDGTPGDKGTYTIAITQVNEPDRNYRYFLEYHRNSMSEDNYTITVDSKGLLQTLNVEAEDKTPAIINKVADTIVNALSAAENARGLAPNVEEAAVPPFTVIFDPQDAYEYSQAFSVMSAAKFKLRVEPTPVPGPTGRALVSRNGKEVMLGSRDASAQELELRSSQGVFFHPPSVVTVTITPLKNQGNPLLFTQSSEIRVPDKHRVAVFDLNRLALVKRTTNLTFTDGNLTTVSETRPSQMLAAVTIPADLAEKAASAVPALIKIQTENANADIKAETARLQAQTERLNAESERLKAQAALAQQRASGGKEAEPTSRTGENRPDSIKSATVSPTPTPTPSASPPS